MHVFLLFNSDIVELNMSHTTSLSLAQIDAHVFAAQAISLDMSKVATGPLNKLITAHANAIGSPSEFIFFPLLSIAPHFTGARTTHTVECRSG